jgi:hypothetical protein
MPKIKKIKVKPLRIVQLEAPKPKFVKVSIQGKTRKTKNARK